MKVKCSREALQRAFQHAASVAPKRSPKAVLTSVKALTKDGVLVLMATNMEIGVRSEVAEVEVERDGECLLPVQRFAAILSEAKAETIVIDADEKGTTVKADRSRFKLSAADPAGFPDVQAFNADAYYKVPAQLFREVIKRTAFASDQTAQRYALGAIAVELTSSTIRGVATDGKRLAMMEGIASAVGKVVDGNPLVPASSLRLAEKFVSDESDVKISVESNSVCIASGPVTFFARLMEGRFPNWSQVIPKNPMATIAVAAGPLLSSVRQAAVVSSEESKGIDVSLRDGVIEIQAETADVGESFVEVPVEYSGESVTVRLDHTRVTDFLRCLDGSQVVSLSFHGSDGAVLAKTDDGYLYVLMPMVKEA